MGWPRVRLVATVAIGRLKSGHPSGSNSAGRVSRCQAECRGFESRLPLHFFVVQGAYAAFVTQPGETRTATFLMTDIAGSTRLWEEQREAMVVALASHDVMLRAAVEEAGGTVVKTTGDGLLAAFERPGAAVGRRSTGQQALGAHPWPTSDAAPRPDGDPRRGRRASPRRLSSGHRVNRVARVLAIGHGGQVLVSAAAAALVGRRPAGRTRRCIDRGRASPQGPFTARARLPVGGIRSRRQLPAAPLGCGADQPARRPDLLHRPGPRGGARSAASLGVAPTRDARRRRRHRQDAPHAPRRRARWRPTTPTVGGWSSSRRCGEPELVASEVASALGVQVGPGAAGDRGADGLPAGARTCCSCSTTASTSSTQPPASSSISSRRCRVAAGAGDEPRGARRPRRGDVSRCRRWPCPTTARPDRRRRDRARPRRCACSSSARRDAAVVPAR